MDLLSTKQADTLNPPRSILIKSSHLNDPEIDDPAVFKTLLDFVYWNAPFPFPLKEKLMMPERKKPAYYVKLCFQAKKFGVRMDGVIVENVEKALSVLLAKMHRPCMVPESLKGAVNMYYSPSRNPTVGSRLGKVLTKGLLMIGHDEYTNDPERLQLFIGELPILGADIAFFGLKNLFYQEPSCKYCLQGKCRGACLKNRVIDLCWRWSWLQKTW